MELFLMRHGVAAAQSPYVDDDQRPLTPQGEQQQRLVVQALTPLLQPLDHLLSSPLRRARQTADIVAETLQLRGAVEETSVLARDCSMLALLRRLEAYPRQARLLCVGHEPHMSRLAVGFLAEQGRGAIAFQPGSVIGLAFPGAPAPGNGMLLFFLRPVDVLSITASPQP